MVLSDQRTPYSIMYVWAAFEAKSKKFILRLGAQSSYVVKYFEGSNAVKTTSMRN